MPPPPPKVIKPKAPPKGTPPGKSSAVKVDPQPVMVIRHGDFLVSFK